MFAPNDKTLFDAKVNVKTQSNVIRTCRPLGDALPNCEPVLTYRSCAKKKPEPPPWRIQTYKIHILKLPKI